MEATTHTRDHENALILAISVLFERASYYGIRALIVLYMMTETIGLSQASTFEVYGLIGSFLLVTMLIGGVFGDFVLGHKKSIIAGGLLQVVGCFVMCIPDRYALYLGLVLLILGAGLYRSNLLASYGKAYYNQPQYLDTAFSLMYIIVNLGSFFGVLLIGYIGSEIGYVYGFYLAAIFYLFAAALPFAVKQKQLLFTYKEQNILPKCILYVSGAILLSGIFWVVYDMGMIQRMSLITDSDFREQLRLYFSEDVLNGIDFYIAIPSLILFGIIWLKYHRFQILKITIGFVFATLALLLLLEIPTVNLELKTSFFIVATFFFILAEVFIGPIVLSVITRYTNPKYLATVMGLSSSVVGLLLIVSGQFNDTFYDNPVFIANTGLIISGIIITLLIIGLLIGSKYFKSNV